MKKKQKWLKRKKKNKYLLLQIKKKKKKKKKRLETLCNKDDHKSIDKKIFDRVVIERFDEIKELTNEIDHDDLIYHFKNNTNKNINDFDDGIELFQKIQSGEMN